VDLSEIASATRIEDYFAVPNPAGEKPYRQCLFQYLAARAEK